jgi:4-hydroxy-3-polyprenylbenzoate decarboxylase
MAPPGDLRDWIGLLEREGELVRVSAEVDPHLEVTEIVDRVVKAGGPALMFERPKGSSYPLLVNQFGTERRMCLAFDADSLDEVGRRLGDVLEMQPPQVSVMKRWRRSRSTPRSASWMITPTAGCGRRTT